MLKLSGNIAHIRTPKMRASAELNSHLFGRVGETGSHKAVMDRVAGLNGEEKKRFYKPVASWSEERKGARFGGDTSIRYGEHPMKEIGVDEALIKNFEKNKYDFAEEVSDMLFNPEKNGMMARECMVPDRLADRYGEVARNDPFGLYFGAYKRGKNPYNFFLEKESANHNILAQNALREYKSSKPTWIGWKYDGSSMDVERLREYEKIYDSMGDMERRQLSMFVAETDLPVESAIQMLSPEYYNWMKESRTPFYEMRYVQEGKPVVRLRGKKGENLDRVRYLKDINQWGGDKMYGHEHYYGPGMPNDVLIVEKDVPLRRGGLSPYDLMGMVNNVQYSGTAYPYASRFYPGGSDGYMAGKGLSNKGVNYGTWDPRLAEFYVGEDYGRRLAYTVGGRPLLGDDYYARHGKRDYGILRIKSADGRMRFFDPEKINGEDIDFLNQIGYGYFGDVSHENQFVFGPRSSVKSLVGGSGNFDYRSPNIYERSGGTIESTGDTARHARMFGLDGRRGVLENLEKEN